MHDYVCVLCGSGEGVDAVVVAVEDADARVDGGKGGGCAAEERGEGPVWVCLHERGEDGAADVACCAGAGGGGVSWAVYGLGEGKGLYRKSLGAMVGVCEFRCRGVVDCDFGVVVRADGWMGLMFDIPFLSPPPDVFGSVDQIC